MATIFENITVDTDFFATYTKTIKFTVTWKDWDGITIKTEQVKKGTGATPPPDPTRDGGYRFDKWVGSYSSITADTEVKAEYIKTYTVKWIGYGGTVLKTEVVDTGKNSTAPTPPTVDGRTFSKWSHDGTAITSDLEITAEYIEVKLELKVLNYVLSDGVIKEGFGNVYSALYFRTNNFGKGMFVFGSVTERGNQFKIAVTYGGSVVGLSSCEITLSDTANYTLDKSTSLLTRVLEDKYYLPSSGVGTSTITIKYKEVSSVYNLDFSGSSLCWCLDFKTPSSEGSTWWNLYPRIKNPDSYGRQLYTDKKDLEQFNPKFFYRKSISGYPYSEDVYLDCKIVEGEYIDGSKSYQYVVNIPSGIDYVHGVVELNQKKSNGFRNETKVKFETPLDAHRGSIEIIE